MGAGPSTESHVAAIYNQGWVVRHRNRGIRLNSHAQARDEAIHELGLVVRKAFQECDDFKTLLTALVDALSPRPPDF